MNSIHAVLLMEKETRLKGGLYHMTQIQFCYNSNRIEGSKLSQEQTRFIFETNTIDTEKYHSANVDDIIETVNHFACFDYMIDNAEKPLSEDMIKEFHRILKTGTSQSRKDWFKVGDYKRLKNTVGETETTDPQYVKEAMGALLNEYNGKKNITIHDIIEFHYFFEKIHPFQDGNGRVGRLVMFKEYLKYHIVPFIIENDFKNFYYRGLREYKDIPGYLNDTCLHAQDKYNELLQYFNVPDTMT